MNIAMIGTHDISGGAARAMYRLHQGFQAIGENSYILSKIKKSDDPKVIHINPVFDPSKNPDIEKQKWIQEEYIDKGRSELSNTLFTFAYPGYDLSQFEAVQMADIINIHWVAWFQSPETIAALLRLGKPVVWTLHDMRAFTGGCHYSAGCDKFTTDCVNCPQIKNDYLNIPSKVLKLQKKMYGNNKLTIVTPSHWLASEAKRSTIFRNARIEIIPNGLDLNIFRPTDKREAIERLGLDPNKKYLLFGADSTGSTYKGFDLLIEVLKKLKKEMNIVLLIFGNEHSDIKQLDTEYVSYSKISDDKQLSLIYAAADIFLLTSREDNLPNVMLESMACGTPVIGFEVGGLVDLVKNGETGFLVEKFNTKKMSMIIEEILDNDAFLDYMSIASRKFAIENLSIELQADKYRKLFNGMFNYQPKSIDFILHKKVDINRMCIFDKIFENLPKEYE